MQIRDILRQPVLDGGQLVAFKCNNWGQVIEVGCLGLIVVSVSKIYLLMAQFLLI